MTRAAIFGVAVALFGGAGAEAGPSGPEGDSRLRACLADNHQVDACFGHVYESCAQGADVARLPACAEAEYRAWQAVLDADWAAAQPVDAAALARHRAFIAAREAECDTGYRLRIDPIARLVLAWTCRAEHTAMRVGELRNWRMAE